MGLVHKISKDQIKLAQGSHNSLPNNKISDWSKLKAFVDDRIKYKSKIEMR